MPATNMHNCLSTELSFMLLEIDYTASKDVSTLYVYPAIPNATIHSTCVQHALKEGKLESFIYFKVKNDWVYMLTVPNQGKSVVGAPGTNTLSFCVFARPFNPEKFAALIKLLLHQYTSHDEDPTKILAAYLSIHMTGTYTDHKNAALSFQAQSFLDSDALKAVSAIKDVYSGVGSDIIVLYNAVMLKKRILVYGEPTSLHKLMSVVRTLPQLAWHRQDWSILRPIVSDDAAHIDDLSSSGVFIAGTIDESLIRNQDLFDVVLDLRHMTVTVNSHAVSGMKMCQIHRELSALLEKATQANEDITSHEIMAIVAKKSTSILNQLRMLIPEGSRTLTEEIIKSNVTANPALQQWLCRLAIAENMM